MDTGWTRLSKGGILVEENREPWPWRGFLWWWPEGGGRVGKCNVSLSLHNQSESCGEKSRQRRFEYRRVMIFGDGLGYEVLAY